MRTTKDLFFEKTASFEDIPLYQAKGSFRGENDSDEKLAFYLDDENAPTVGCWGKVYKFANIKLLQIQSLCYNAPKDESIGELLVEMHTDFPIVNIKDENIYRPELEKVFRVNGYRRPLGQFGTSLTVIVNTSEPITYSRMWKRNIRSAKEQPMVTFAELNPPTTEQLDEIAGLFEENSRQKHLSYCYTQKDLERWLSDEKFRLFVVKFEDAIIAARIIMVNGIKSADVATANGDKARSVKGSTQYLVDGIFETLRNEGVQMFDFSCIPIGRKGAEGICEFKGGVTSGRLVQYNGDWLYTRKNWQRWMVRFINKYIRKVYEY